jgi:hypothetical protein
VFVWQASKGWTTFTAIVTFYLALSPKLAKWGISVFGTVSPWWALVPVGLLFIYGLLRTNLEEYQRVAANTAVDASKLRAYESRDPSRVVARVDEYKTIDMRVHEPDADGFREHPVPYEPDYLGTPFSSTTLNVGTLGRDYFISLGDEADSLRGSPRPAAPIRVETFLHVRRHSDKGEQVFRRLGVYTGQGEIVENGPPHWRYKVACTTTLSDLPEGVYSFEVHDRTNAPGKGILYSNMHLTISRLGEN